MITRPRMLLRGTLAFALVFGAAMATVALLMPNDRLLARFDPDGSPNGGFVEWEDLQKSWWTSLDQTSYEGGEPVAAARITRAAPNRITILRTEKDGTSSGISVTIAQNGDQVKRVIDPAASPLDRLLATETGQPEDTAGSFDLDMEGSVTRARLDGGRTLAFGPAISLYYLSSQELYINGELAARRTYPTVESTPFLGIRPTLAEDRDKDGTLLRRITYAYDGYRRTVKTYNETGKLISTSETGYDWMGGITWRRTHDASGLLVSEERYRYRFWERLASWPGLVVSAVSLGLALTTARLTCKGKADQP